MVDALNKGAAVARKPVEVDVMSVSDDVGGATAPAPVELPPAARLAGLSPYVSPVPETSIDLWLNANEGAPDAGGAWLRAVADAIATGDAAAALGLANELNRYPDAAEVERRLAEQHGVDPSRVVLTAGGDDAIARLSQAVLEPGRSLVMHDPTFVMISHWARMAQAEIRRVRWLEEPAFPLDEMLGRIDHSTSVVAVVTPNNPTGAVVGREQFVALAERARPGLVLLDHAYVEFAREDFTSLALELGNVVVIRTFSKARGLAGLRLGYALGPRRVIEWMRTAGGPYPTSSLSLAAALWSLSAAGERAMQATVAAMARHRPRIIEVLQELGAKVLPSEGNFVCASFADSDGVRQALAGQGIAVRGFAGHPVLGPWLRISLPVADDHFARLENALRNLPRALCSR